MSSKEQDIQEVQYDLPYHYIPSIRGDDFKLFLYWSWGLNYLSSTEYLLELLEGMDYESLIDVGCGDGRFLQELYHHSPDKKLLGIDYSKRAIDLANALNPKVAYQQVDILTEPAAHNFDVVTLIEVLEHIPLDTAHQFVEAVGAFQHTGGKLILTVPHSNRPVQKKHFQHFNSDSLLEHLEKTYQVDQFFFFDNKSKKVNLIRRLLKNRLFILNHQPTLNRLYKYYKDHFFHCEESECARLGVIATKK